MTEIELRDLVYNDFYTTSIGPQYKFLELVGRFSDRQWRYDPDLESDLVDQLCMLAQNCDLKYMEGCYYIFDGKIYVHSDIEIIESAFKLWLTRLGLKINQRRKDYLFKNIFLSHLRLSNKLCQRLDVIAFKNGVLDLTDGTLNEFDKKYHVTYYHPYKYDKRAKCPKWQKFLREVLPDKASRVILQMFLGLGLIERGTVYNSYEGKNVGKVELCLILIGSGANGKSVIYQTAMGIFGKNRISGIDYDEITGSGDEGMRARRLLRDAIFNWSSDSDSRTFGRKRTGVFKRIVSGEPITDRAIGGNVQQNYNMPYLIFNLNDLPYPDDNSLGFIRRLQFVTFDITIPAVKQNKTLAQDLVKEYPGIFNWVMRGMYEIRRRKFQFPSSEGNTRQMLLTQLQGNPIIAWVNAYRIRWEPGVIGEQGVYVPTRIIMQSIEQFCSDNDVQIPTKQKIGTTLGNLNFMKRRMSEGFSYKMYGVSTKDLLRPFLIRNERFDSDMRYLEGEDETYIIPED